MKVDLDSVRLRKLEMRDGPALRAGLEDGRLARNMNNIPFPYPDGEEVRFIERAKDGRPFAVAGMLNGTETLFGTCSIYHLPDTHDENEYDIGYMVFEKFWNQGVGTRAVELLIQTAPRDARIFAGVMNDNPASMRVFEKLGFVRYGESTCESKGRGEVVPTTLFELKR